jgi:hypothetical protein
MQLRTTLCVWCLAGASVSGCTGSIADPRTDNWPNNASLDASGGRLARAGSGAGGAAASGLTGVSGSLAPLAGAPGVAAPGGGFTVPNMRPSGVAGSVSTTASTIDPNAVTPGGESLGNGDITKPALGPAPTEASKVPGAPFVLVKNWNFGATGTIKDIGDLISEFQFHDQFNTIANGTNYGSVTVAPTAATAIAASNLGLPSNRQPVEDPARPNREFTPDSIITHVLPLSASDTTLSASSHDTGNGSFTAKWALPSGGTRLKRDLLWESRVRIPRSAPGFWFSLWTAGKKWNKGAEMDVVESFGTPNIGTGAKAFHVNSVGGQDKRAFSSWPSELSNIGVPAAARDLANWHVFTWVYLADDTYQVYFDDYLVQQGTVHWTLTGSSSGEAIDMWFLFDFGWGHTQVKDVNISLPASNFPVTYELDYSRVYMR